MYFVYVLVSHKDKKLYTGFTENIERRVKDHNYGKTPSTKLRQPLELIYYEAHLSKNDALKRERYFKTSKGKTTLKQVLHDSMQALMLQP
ncbi:MAG: GIY-YIG nuclease family protein [Candidatus Omnitrophota bacterium]